MLNYKHMGKDQAHDEEHIYDAEPEDTIKETDAKCPNCAATITFDPVTGMLHCDYCGFSREISRPEENQTVSELDFYAAEHSLENFRWGEGKKSVLCASCGGESIYDTLMVSNVCPYCGSNHVMEEKARDSLAPNGICPFVIGMQLAEQNFKRWIKKRLFAPSKAKRTANAAPFLGMFLPHWTFDTKTISHYHARAGRTRVVGTGKNTRTVTHWFGVSGIYQKNVDDELVCGTTRHQKDILEKIRPFNTASCVPYNPEYLSGFVSERYSNGLADSWTVAQERIKAQVRNEITSEIRFKYHADKVSGLSFSILFNNITYKYLMLPIWMSNFNYNNKRYEFMVNGQTGRVGGKFPVSPIRVIIAILLGIAAIALLSYILPYIN